MTPERWHQVKALFRSALEHEVEERTAFLDRACAGGDSLRREVESLLASFEESDEFIQKPVAEAAADLFREDQTESLVGQRLGNCEIVSLLGEGGMGAVYLARDTRLGRKVALKLLPSYFTNDSDRLRRFELEACAASALNHPNILTIYEIGETDETHFIATEFIEGETLRDHIAGATMKIVDVLYLAEQIASALAAAHEAGIIHRDIKPENIMVRHDALVKVLDFGLAKLINEPTPGTDAATRAPGKTNPGVVMGTVHYMSPEQTRGLPVDARTDVWSLGCVLYEMVSGRVPFERETSSDVIAAILEREPIPLARYAPDVPTEVESIVQKALRKDPEERYHTAKELLTDLKSLKQRLEFEAELERSATPEKDSEAKQLATHVGDLGVGTAEVAAAQTSAGSIQRTSSAEYIVSQVKRHKLAALLILMTLGLATITAAYVVIPRYFVRSDEAGVHASSSAGKVRSIAVLPFRNINGTPDMEYLSDGISESLINNLSQLPDMKVIARSSSFKYKGIEVDPQEVSNALGVEGVLIGRVEQRGENLLISVELVNARDKTQVWGEQYNRRASDVLAVLSEISGEIAAKLRLRLTPGEQQQLAKRYTSNPEAYNYYAKAMYHFHNMGPDLSTRPESDLAVDLFKKAIELDPKYALAHAQLGYAYVRIAVFQEDSYALIEQAKHELAVAEKLDPQLAQVHAARYFIAFSQYEDWQVETGIRELRLAQQLDPNVGHSELGDLYVHIGLEKQADEEYEIALKVDPGNNAIKRAYVNQYFLTAKPDEALEANKRFFNRGPDLTYYLEKKMLKEAAPLIEEAYQKDSNTVESWDAIKYRALWPALQGKHREAQAAIPSILKARRNRGYHHSTYDIARIYALGGKSEEALKWLRVTVQEGFPCYPLFARDSFLDPIRNDPGFIQFMAEMRTRWEGYQREFG